MHVAHTLSYSVSLIQKHSVERMNDAKKKPAFIQIDFIVAIMFQFSREERTKVNIEQSKKSIALRN